MPGLPLRRTWSLWATAAVVLAVVALSACGSADAAGPVGAPSAAAPSEAAPTGAALPAVTGKLRGYGTVRQVSEAADLVVRGEVEATGFRMDEVLRAANGSSIGAGTRRPRRSARSAATSGCST
ncbi:hypothetical protein [Micromonospora zamorensis]|uniref:hypothetical protein n=1 Tax=Micromonospora zamorensis TaxID=709883 RepID=UPI003CE7DDE6